MHYEAGQCGTEASNGAGVSRGAGAELAPCRDGIREGSGCEGGGLTSGLQGDAEAQGVMGQQETPKPPCQHWAAVPVSNGHLGLSTP